MTATTPGAPKRSLFKLIGELPTLLVNLLRAELDSFKQEISAKLKAAGIGVGLLAAAATFLFFAVGVLLAAAVAGLATVLPVWASALIIGGVILLIAVVLALIGITSLRKGVPPTPEHTIESVKKDVRTIRGIEKESV
jgi:hypothetical protein